MPGLSGRMSTVIKAKISKLLDRAEDPGETLEYSYQKQIELLQNVKKGMADVVTAMQRALDKTENMKARASAVGELEQAGTFEDLTQLGSGEDDIDRQLKQLSSSTEVDSELEKMKAELGAGSAGELGAGSSGGAEREQAPQQEQKAP